MPQQLTARILSDVEGYAFIKRSKFARKSLLYARVHGGVLSVQTTAKSCVQWDACLLRCTVSSSRAKSFNIHLASGSWIYVTLREQVSRAAQWCRVIEMASGRTLEAEYTLGEKIGEGSFASVHQALRNRTGGAVAVKTIVKRQFDIQMTRELDREVLACASLQVPGIVSTFAVFHTQQKVHIVMELMRGGTLKERVQSAGGSVTEMILGPILFQTLSTLATLHRVGVAHRDVKLENILCETPKLPTNRTALCDLGYVNFLDPGEETMRSLVGTPVYVAPEIAERKPYGVGVDIWAAGVMAFRMISGVYPYDCGDDDEATMAAIVKGNLKFPSDQWRSVSPECISLIRGLMQPKTNLRLSAVGALQHRFFENVKLPEENETDGDHTRSNTHEKAGIREFQGGLIEEVETEPTSTIGLTNSLPLSAKYEFLSLDVQPVKRANSAAISRAELVTAAGNRLALRLVEASSASNPTSADVPIVSRRMIRHKLRVSVAMIAFFVRLGVSAKLRRAPGVMDRKKKDRIADFYQIPASVHPCQLVPLVDDTVITTPTDFGDNAADILNTGSPVGSDVSTEGTSSSRKSPPSETTIVPALSSLFPDKERGDEANRDLLSKPAGDIPIESPPRTKGIRRLLSLSLSTPRSGGGRSGRSPRPFGSLGRRTRVETPLTPEPKSAPQFATKI